MPSKLPKNLFNYYTGVGSRNTPQTIGLQMQAIAKQLAAAGYILRSGGASGADSFFESGLDPDNFREIYLPWANFNNNLSPLFKVCNKAMQIAEGVHPNWKRLSNGGKKLHARNVYQVLGRDLKTPSKFLVCWTPNGEAVGGTRTAIKIAEAHNVPVCNLAVDDWNVFRQVRGIACVN